MKRDLALLQRRVRIVARALGRHGLSGAWGHCSARIDDTHFLVCAAKPMGIIKPGEDGTVVSLAAPLPPGVLGEVRIHQQIYARRPDVGGICRVMPPQTMALSALRLTPQPRHGVGAFVDRCPLWDDPRLLRDDAMAAALAGQLGAASVIVMRGNGAVAVGERIETALAHAWCLEDAARIEHAVRSISNVPERSMLNGAEIEARQVTSGRVFERLWEYLTDGDPEAMPADEAFAAS